MAQDYRTVCWNGIVKNESQTIQRCMESLVGEIDYWVIVDTGSTDGTQDIIREFMSQHNVPGELHERPWVNFGHNRTEALRLAEGKADYLLFCDADMALKVNVTGWKNSLTADAYFIIQQNSGGGLLCRNMRLVNARLTGAKRLRYLGATHEVCDAEVMDTLHQECTNDIVFLDYADGGSKSDKYIRDIALLEEELATLEEALSADGGSALSPEKRNRLEGLLSRTLFYLGQSYVNGKIDLEKGIAAYRRRVELGGWSEEIFYSWFDMGACLVALGREWNEAHQAFLSAYQVEPSRAESLLRIIRHYNQSGQYHLAYLYSTVAKEIPMPNDGLFVDPRVYAYEIPYAHAIASYWTGRYQEAAQYFKRSLDSGALPDELRPQVETNYAQCVQELSRKSEVGGS